MLRYTVVFFVIAAIAGIFAFGDVEGSALLFVKTVFFVSLALFFLSIIVSPQRRL